MNHYLKKSIYLLILICSFVSSCKKDIEPLSDIYGNKSTIDSDKSEIASDSESMNFIIAGDPQGFRLMNDEPGYTGDPNSINNRSLWKKIISTTVSSMNSLPDIRFSSINGDITEFGRQVSWDAFYDVFGKARFPVLIGLGNHDYANNVSDCWQFPYLSSDGCAYASVMKLAINVRDQSLINKGSRDFTFHNSFFSWDRFYTGSLSYSWDTEDIHFVQLNNYPTYQTTLTSGLITRDIYISKTH